MSRDSQGPRKTFSKGGSSDFNKRKSYSSSDKPKRPYKSASSEGSSFKKRDGDSTEKRSYTKRDSSESRPRKTYGDSEKTSFSGEKRSFGKRQDGSFRSKSSGSFGADREKRSYTKREDSDRPRRSFDDGEKKPFVKRADGKYESAGPRKSFGDGEKRSYTKREDSDRPRRSFGDGERKPFVKREDGKYESAGSRKSFGDTERKSFSKRDGGDYEKSGRSFGEKKSFDKPYEPRLSKTERVIEKSKKAGPSKTSTQKNVSDDAVRLNRYVANAGICSRREADVLIATGVVSVNGKIITEMGYKVNPTDVVTYGGVPIKNEVKKYLILNKPKDYITTMDDPEERRTVMELIRKACKERLYPVGRLDRNTTGILLFTNDGDMTAKLTHPKFDVRKVYHVTLDKKMTTEDFRTLSEGVDLADGFIKPDAVEFVGTGKFELGVEIHSGKNRIVRRMFEHLGYEVVKLDRVAFAGLTKKDLPRAKFRFLTEKEISFLKMLG
ncbi:MAG: rRNA pseudouridine synthase [Bacteroidetes bacterium]|nr:rRNA pseudouridine synthase [Bacteroidota bacterium]